MQTMTIKAAMSEMKRQRDKVEDLKSKIQAHAADMDYENPKYPNQTKVVEEWVQSARDAIKRIGKLKQALSQTNITVMASVVLEGKMVTHTLTYWIARRRELAALEYQLVGSLQDRGLKDGHIPSVSGGEPKAVKVRRYFDLAWRDQTLMALREEPSRIDEVLELVNATTPLIGLED